VTHAKRTFRSDLSRKNSLVNRRTGFVDLLPRSTAMMSIRRCMRLPGVGLGCLLACFAVQPAIPSLSALIVGDSVEKIGTLEVRPELVRDVNLGIGDLPKQEIAHAKFAARAN